MEPTMPFPVPPPSQNQLLLKAMRLAWLITCRRANAGTTRRSAPGRARGGRHRQAAFLQFLGSRRGALAQRQPVGQSVNRLPALASPAGFRSALEEQRRPSCPGSSVAALAYAAAASANRFSGQEIGLAEHGRRCGVRRVRGLTEILFGQFVVSGRDHDPRRGRRSCPVGRRDVVAGNVPSRLTAERLAQRLPGASVDGVRAPVSNRSLASSPRDRHSGEQCTDVFIAAAAVGSFSRWCK